MEIQDPSDLSAVLRRQRPFAVAKDAKDAKDASSHNWRFELARSERLPLRI